MRDRYSNLLKRNTAGGGLTVASLSAWQCLLGVQDELRIAGNFLELGIWHGIGLSAMGINAGKNDRLFGIDLYLQRPQVTENFEAITGNQLSAVTIIEASSSAVRKTGALASVYNTFRWMHVDGEHSFDAVCNDIELAMLLMRDDGIIVVDDFFNIASANVTHGLFHMLDRNPQYIRMFLAGANKAYLASPKFYGVYRAACRDRLPRTAIDLFDLNLVLARNGHDREIDYLTFFEPFGNEKAMKIGAYLDDVPNDL